MSVGPASRSVTNSIALGNAAVALGPSSVVIGQASEDNGYENCVVIGNNIKAQNSDAVYVSLRTGNQVLVDSSEHNDCQFNPVTQS